MSSRSAILIEVPAAEAAVGELRLRHDPSAAAGVPAHVTLLYPWILPDDIDDAALGALHGLARLVTPFAFSLVRCERFADGTLYLAPEPAAPLRDLIAALWDRWPAYPPYGGTVADPVPHLTVAHQPDHIDDALIEVIAPQLPIRSHADALSVYVSDKRGHWRRLAEVPFGGV